MFFFLLRFQLLDLSSECNRFIPRYFVQDYKDGYAALTPDGLAAVEEELKEDTAYCIEGVDPKATLTPGKKWRD